MAQALEAGDTDAAAGLAEEIALLKRRRRSIPWVDPFDVRYRRFEARPRPSRKRSCSA